VPPRADPAVIRRSDVRGRQETYARLVSRVGREPLPVVGWGWLQRVPGDAVLAVVVALVQVVGTAVIGAHDEDRKQLDGLAVTLLLVGPAALVVRRRRPVAVLAVTVAAILAYTAIGYVAGPTFGALIVALYTAVTRGHRAVAYASIALCWVAFTWNEWALGDSEEPGLGESLAIAAWLLLVAATGEIVRIRRAYLGESRRRAEEAQRTRREELLRREGEERLRIAQELHDVLAHNISLISIQAGAGELLLGEGDEQARASFRAIKRASKDALRELRSVLDVLRSDVEAAPRGPAPTLAQVDELVERARAAGVDVEAQVEGTRRSLPAAVELAAYRILQEAVTNVIRHAGPARATLRLVYGDDALVVQVEDDGRGAAATASPGGKGLAGMAERAVALGGSVESGPRPGGGFRVRGRLPLEARR
jgi:signal transduction histidine kinase